MYSTILKTYDRSRFIREMNRKWQEKYKAEQAWLKELDNIEREL